MMKIGLSLLYLASAPITLSSATIHISHRNTDTSNTAGAPIIDLGYAQYQGVYDSVNDVTNYLGVRYAAPPTGQWIQIYISTLKLISLFHCAGDLRWRAPQSPANNSSAGVQQANTQPNPCPQASTGDASTNPLEGQSSLTRRADAPGTGPEDCLFLKYVRYRESLI